MRKLRTVWMLLVLCLAAVALLGPSPAGAADRPDYLVTMKKFTYYPNVLEVRPGETIGVRNWDGERYGIPHSLTAYDRSFDTGVFVDGMRVITAPQQKGVYQFFCIVHPEFMRGKLRVTGLRP